MKITIDHSAMTPLGALLRLIKSHGDDVACDGRGGVIVTGSGKKPTSAEIIDFDPRLVEFARAMKGDGPEAA